MSEKSAWEKVLEQISSPWDWAAAAAGAAGGLGVTLLLHGTDLGNSIAAGATGGVAVSKAASASLQGRQLKRKARGLNDQIEQTLQDIEKLFSKSPASAPASAAAPAVPPTAVKEDPTYRLLRLQMRLKQEIGLRNNKATSNEEFAKQIDKLTEEYRQIISSTESS